MSGPVSVDITISLNVFTEKLTYTTQGFKFYLSVYSPIRKLAFSHASKSDRDGHDRCCSGDGSTYHCKEGVQQGELLLGLQVTVIDVEPMASVADPQGVVRLIFRTLDDEPSIKLWALIGVHECHPSSGIIGGDLNLL